MLRVRPALHTQTYIHERFGRVYPSHQIQKAIHPSLPQLNIIQRSAPPITSPLTPTPRTFVAYPFLNPDPTPHYQSSLSSVPFSLLQSPANNPPQSPHTFLQHPLFFPCKAQPDIPIELRCRVVFVAVDAESLACYDCEVLFGFAICCDNGGG
jgi:hypothetical protein